MRSAASVLAILFLTGVPHGAAYATQPFALTIRISSDGPCKGRARADFPVVVALTNLTGSDLRLASFRPPELAYRIVVKTDDGASAEKTAFGQLASGKVGRVSKDANTDVTLESNSSTADVASGGTIEECVSLADSFDLSQPWVYHAHLERIIPKAAGAGIVSSNTVSFYGTSAQGSQRSPDPDLLPDDK